MILYSYFELAASLFILLLAFHLFISHHECRSARFYVRFALLAFLACIFTYSLRIAFTLELARDINRISATLIAFSFSAFTHFVLIFTKKERFLNSRLALPLLYVPPAIIGCLFLFTNLMYSRYEILSYGIVSQPAPLYSLFLIQTAVYNFIGIYLLFLYSRLAHQKIEQQQALLLAIGSIIPVVMGVLTDQILPLFLNGRVFPPTVVFDFAIWNFFIYLAMRHCSLFAISPGAAARTIIETMPDSLIVTDTVGRIMFINEEAKKYFHAEKEEIRGQDIRQLFEQKDKFDQLYKSVVEKKLEIERFEAVLCDPLGECLPSLINANTFRDEIGGLLGIIFVIRDVRG